MPIGEGAAGSWAPPQGPQIAISSEICPGLSNRFNNRLLFCKQLIYCFTVNCLSCTNVQRGLIRP